MNVVTDVLLASCDCKEKRSEVAKTLVSLCVKTMDYEYKDGQILMLLESETIYNQCFVQTVE
jgi:hypothetical protein